MKKNLAVLLLRMAGAEEWPTKEYAELLFTNAGRGTRNLVDYYDEMSHGRLDLSASRVYDWIDYGHTNKEIQDIWEKAKDSARKRLLNDNNVAKADIENEAIGYANRVKRTAIVQWARDAAAENEFDLDDSDILVCVFNQPVDYFGYEGVAVVAWNPEDLGCFSVDLAGVSHEVGHALGLNHSRMQGYKNEYGDQWDIMSSYGTLHFDLSGGPIPPGSPYFTYGPGLNAVNMDIVGWLDPSRVASGGLGSYLFEFRPLHRHDLPGWLAAKLRFGNEIFYVEFRMDDGWDVKFKAPCILLHKLSVHPKSGRPCSEILVAQPGASAGARADLRTGRTFEIGDKDDLFGIYARITVREINRADQTALVEVYVREHRPFEPGAGIPFGGVTVDGGGFIWVPGRGPVRVPPRSPILSVLEQLAEAELLQTMSRGEYGLEIDRLVLGTLITARDALSAIIEARQAPQVPSLPPQSDGSGSV